jgi:hypothetical protein
MRRDQRDVESLNRAALHISCFMAFFAPGRDDALKASDLNDDVAATRQIRVLEIVLERRGSYSPVVDATLIVKKRPALFVNRSLFETKRNSRKSMFLEF